MIERISLTIPADTLERADARSEGNRSAAIAEIIDRYHDLISAIKRDLGKTFSERGEKGLIIDALNGSWLRDHMSIHLLPHNVVDAIEMDALDKKWEVDGGAMKSKIKSTTIGERYAIADAVTLWWKRSERDYNDLFTN